MSEIKFRAWDKELKRMFLEVQQTYDNSGKNQIRGDSFGGLINNEDIEIMQFTGLKDKNGKEIYEGDIVKLEDELSPKEIGEMKFVDGCFCIGKYEVSTSPWDPKDLEILGNIYENPELLRGK